MDGSRNQDPIDGLKCTSRDILARKAGWMASFRWVLLLPKGQNLIDLLVRRFER